VLNTKAKILIIDDEREICRFVEAGLSEDSQEVLEARTAKEGISFAATQNPDLILLDLGLPDGDGIEVLQRIREWSKIPVIILSARGDDESKVRALDVGADDYLTKPFSMSELRARIRAHLRRAGESRDAEQVSLTLGEIEVDLAAHVVRRAGEEVHLTPLEFELFVTLLRNRGKVVPHRMLLTTVWGPAYANDHHYLRVFMANLRHKLEQNPAEPRYLLTEPGIGYRLVGDD
jgi:two-component system, OmpR family, KDP operon response regulator KdpE